MIEELLWVRQLIAKQQKQIEEALTAGLQKVKSKGANVLRAL